jgi:nucleoside-diphosphate-sugar epimerase
MLADNFVKACQLNHVKQIIYVGGVVPNGHISQHLESRREIETIMTQSGINYTILRAGLIVGNGGSSFEILKNLAINLPAMVLPKWTTSHTQVIYINDVVRIINHSIQNEDFINKKLNAVTHEDLRYRDLITKTIKRLGKKKLLLSIPINNVSFSKLWVSLFGHSNYELVSPLIDSLLCDFSAIYPEETVEQLIQYKTFDSMLEQIKKEKSPRRKPYRSQKSTTARSIQRLGEKIEIPAKEVANLYMDWLPKYFFFLIRIHRDGNIISFRLFNSITLLRLKYIYDPNMKDRAKFHIVGGLLCQEDDTGWLEFRSVNEGQFFLASINEFIPTLPWFIYRYSQAALHKNVMDNFGKYVQKKNLARRKVDKDTADHKS